MRYLFLTKSGYSPENAVKSLETEKKLRSAMDRSYGTGIVTGDRYLPGARGADFAVPGSGDLGPDSAATTQQEAANTQMQAADKQVTASDKLLDYIMSPTYSGNRERDYRAVKANQAWRAAHPEFYPAQPTAASSAPTYTPPAAASQASVAPASTAAPSATTPSAPESSKWKRLGVWGLGIWAAASKKGRKVLRWGARNIGRGVRYLRNRWAGPHVPPGESVIPSVGNPGQVAPGAPAEAAPANR